MSQKRVIVADDSLTIRKMIEMGLRQEGYEVITTKTGEECLATATASIPDLILVDYMLPDMQATELCQWLMQSPITMGVPVLLISGDGDAARQLYQDAENVVDYLTKPFAPNVLKAVVKNLLTKPDPDPKLKSTIIVPSEASPPMEVEENAGALDVSDKLMKKFDQLLRTRMAAASRNIPEWESQRGEQPAEGYYVDLFSKAGLFLQITRDMMSTTKIKEDLLFRFKTDFMSADAAITCLDSIKATGMFRIELPQETVLAFLEAGQIIAITSNDPRSYCKGATVDFRNLPQEVVAAAVVAQRKSYIPFYVSLHMAGHLPDQEMFEGLMRAQGETSIARAFAAESVACSFTVMDPLPELVVKYRIHYPMLQILLITSRIRQDTTLVEQTIPHLDVVPSLSEQSDEIFSAVSPQANELAVLKLVDGHKTIHQISLETKLPPADVVKIIYCFVKLGALNHPVPAVGAEDPSPSAETA